MEKSHFQALANKFCPQVRLSRTSPYKDEFWPCSVEWYINRCTMLDKEDPSFKIVHPTLSDMANNPAPTRYLKPDNEQVYLGDINSAKMYVHIRKATDITKDWIDIQYWFFYAYNGKIGFIFPLPFGGAHEADLEHVTVRVSNWQNINNSKVEAVFFAAHGSGEGKWLTKETNEPRDGYYTLIDGSHPVTYSAWHSHADYENSGLHWRLVTGYFANDVCSGGYAWGPSDNAELIAVDTPLCEGCTNAGWLNFTGHFGSDKDSPAGPSHQGAWKNDGDNGYYYEMETLGTFGEDWGENRETTGIALGSLNDKQVIAVSRNKGDHARFAIYYWDNGLQVLALGGNSWGDNRGATAIAFGILNNQKVVGVTRSAGDHDRFEIYKWRNGLEMLTWGGTDWGSSREGTGIAFGLVNGEGVVCVSRNGSDHAEVFCYKYINNELVAYATKGVDWGDERGATCIAFGTLNDDLVVGYGRNRGNHNRGGILKWV